MARTVKEIKQQIQDIFISEMAAIGINVPDPTIWSITSLIGLIMYVFALCAYTLEVLFDTHAEETTEKIKQLKPPSKQWYANKIKNFQFGFPLIPGTDEFDNTGYTDDQIEASKVIKHVAIIKQVNVYDRVRLRIKIAGANVDDLVQSSPDVVAALKEYLDSVAAPAGDNYTVEGNNHDNIKMKWRIYYDPLILNPAGGRLDGTNDQPVIDAIKSFFVNGILFSSGTYVVVSHIDWVQKVQGVVIPEILSCEANYGDTPLVPITTEYNPDGGWIRFNDDTDLEIEFIAHNAI